MRAETNTDKKDYNKMREEIADFLYMALCVDGFVTFDSFVDEIERHGKKLTGMLFEVRDKKRGTFYISWLAEGL